ncbi:VOC family protein [Micromonospora parathelypteridis]|uniref:Putative enzyme related to lactoylglutathione lyase n=1 Tax=Micromonospora parathelypteridis TaxID=1839617 RepID=A0A840VRJ7_9ACTN|nr:glyoxalase [Micromonospora parathelypteridis]MBB5479315.1 putative enzyme related to lactoylglutathione lyase [Micromonospora parathelypteridis]GGO01888.1 glyoxalase [Micromonospora parathelypteridis]
MTAGMQTVIYPVRELTVAKAIFQELLGVPPHTDQPYYVGFNVAGQEVALDPNGHAKGLTGPTPYWHVDDLPARVKLLIKAGARSVQDATDVGGGKLTATLADADGNIIGLVQPAS